MNDQQLLDLIEAIYREWKVSKLDTQSAFVVRDADIVKKATAEVDIKIVDLIADLPEEIDYAVVRDSVHSLLRSVISHHGRRTTTDRQVILIAAVILTCKSRDPRARRVDQAALDELTSRLLHKQQRMVKGLSKELASRMK